MKYGSTEQFIYGQNGLLCPKKQTSSGGLSKTYSLLNLFNCIIVYHENIKWPTTNLIVDLINQKLI